MPLAAAGMTARFFRQCSRRATLGQPVVLLCLVGKDLGLICLGLVEGLRSPTWALTRSPHRTLGPLEADHTGWLIILSQKWVGISVRVVTRERDGKHATAKSKMGYVPFVSPVFVPRFPLELDAGRDLK